VPTDPDYAELFSALCAEYSGVTGMSVPEHGRRGFGSQALKVNHKIFAMLVNGRLVVKLPRARVTELIETGRGQPFDSGKGTPMKEWVALTGDEAECRALVVEAQTFVG
jgi:TfoX/Sxy family transcriptional regulator of competence genes